MWKPQGGFDAASGETASLTSGTVMANTLYTT